MEFAYNGQDGALRKFRVAGVKEVHVATIKKLAGYNCFVTGDVIEGSSNKAGYGAIEKFVEAQNVSQARSAAGVATTSKHRLLIPASFSDADVIAILGATAALDGRGKSFPISADHPSVHGEHLVGHEGSLGQYVYYTK